MPEVTVLQCDAPGCEEMGELTTVTVGGKTCEVILGPKHLALLLEIAGWGRPVRARPNRPRTRRDTSESRLFRLIDADQK